MDFLCPSRESTHVRSCQTSNCRTKTPIEEHSERATDALIAFERSKVLASSGGWPLEFVSSAGAGAAALRTWSHRSEEEEEEEYSVLSNPRPQGGSTHQYNSLQCHTRNEVVKIPTTIANYHCSSTGAVEDTTPDKSLAPGVLSSI